MHYLENDRKTFHIDKQAALNQTTVDHVHSRDAQKSINCSVTHEHVKHLIKTLQHLECGPARVRAVSLPLAELAWWSGSHLFSLAPLTTAIREVS